MGQSSGVGELEICDTPCPNGIESKVGEQLSFGGRCEVFLFVAAVFSEPLAIVRCLEGVVG
jgi:hypothetical protein